LHQLIFTPAANASGINYASFTFQVQDDGGTSPGADLDPTPKTMTINVVPAVLFITTSSGSAAYTLGGAPVTVDGGVTVTDLSNPNLVSATVSITGGFQSGDSLNFTDIGPIHGSYTPGTGILTLTGNDTLAHYQTALESITFSSSSASLATRTVSFTASD